MRSSTRDEGPLDWGTGGGYAAILGVRRCLRKYVAVYASQLRFIRNETRFIPAGRKYLQRALEYAHATPPYLAPTFSILFVRSLVSC